MTTESTLRLNASDKSGQLQQSECLLIRCEQKYACLETEKGDAEVRDAGQTSTGQLGDQTTSSTKEDKKKEGSFWPSQLDAPHLILLESRSLPPSPK